MNDENKQVDRKDLKIQALLEKVAQAAEENADLRVELTFANHMLQENYKELESLRGEADVVPEETDPTEDKNTD